MLNIKEIDYDVFGRCVSITNGVIEVYVTVDYGPRIIRCGFVGGENFLKEDKEFKLKMDVTESKFTDNTFYIRGGHRCWLSPEIAPRVRYPDNNPVEYVQGGNKVIFVQPEQEANEVRLTLEIEMKEDSNEIIINHKVTNTSYWPKEFSVWPITVMAPGGLAYVPLNILKRALAPNRNFALWSYSKVNDSRFNISDRYFSLKYDPSVLHGFKIGVMQERPWTAFFHHGDMFVKKYSVNPDGAYPDCNSTFEAYVDKNVLEIETLGELKLVQPCDSNSHIEKWLLFKDVPKPCCDDEMDEIALKYDLENTQI